jgi:hypothetical protein
MRSRDARATTAGLLLVAATATSLIAVLAGFQRRHPYRSRLLAAVLGWGDLRCHSAAREFVSPRPFVSLWPLDSGRQASGGEDHA